MAGAYVAGEKPRLSASFTDPSTGNPADPSSLVLNYSVAGGATVQKAYPADIVKDSVGHYHYDFDTTGLSGEVVYEWVGTGSVPTALVGGFSIAAYGNYGFCRLDEFRAYINPGRVDPGPGTDDASGVLAITAASDAIRRALGRTFELQTTAQDRYFTARRPFSSNTINLDFWYPWPAVYPSLFAGVVPAPLLVVDDFVLSNQTLANITVTDVITNTTYVPTQTWPYNAASQGRPFTTLVFAPGTFMPLGQGQLKVNAKWGIITIPTTIKNACLLQASRYFKRRDAPSGGVEGISAMGAVVRVRPGLDPDIELMLTDWRRWWVAA